MPSKLKCLRVSSIDLTRAGMNPESHIRLFKARTGPVEKAEAKTVDDILTAEAVDREIWSYTSAFTRSISSIIEDDIDTDEKRRLMSESVDQFAAAFNRAVGYWLDGKSSIEKGAQAPITTTSGIVKTESLTPAINAAFVKGEVDTLKFQKENMSAEDCAALESLEKKYAPAPGAEPPPAEPPAAPAAATDPPPATEQQQHPAIAKALAEIADMKKQMQTQAMAEVAKKYAILGKDPQELTKTLLEMQNAGDPVYNGYVAALDEQLGLIEKSGLFSEIGKNRSGEKGGAWERIEAAAAEIRKSKPDLSRTESIELACAEHPDFVAEYEAGRN